MDCSKTLTPRITRLRFPAGSAHRVYAKFHRTRRHPFTIIRSTLSCNRTGRPGASVHHLQQCWGHFVEHYERFTEILCAAARNGCDLRHENEYAQLRHWFIGHYCEIAQTIRPYLDIEFAHDQPQMSSNSVSVDYSGQKHDLDVLEKVFMPMKLVDLLCHDTGDLIPQIARVSNAVYRCHESLKA